MNLPVAINDPSLLEHEPLRSHIAVLMCSAGQRSSTKDSVSRFVEAMQRDAQAIAAAKKWACFVFWDMLPNERAFEVTDGGEQLYKVFLEYQHRLYQGMRDRNFGQALQYEAHIHRSGLDVIKAVTLHGHNASGQHSGRGIGKKRRSKCEDTQRSSGPRKAHRQAETDLPPEAGDRSNIRRGSHPTSSSTTQQGSAFKLPPIANGRSTLQGIAKCSTSKKEKKRKASSQKPPVITPSDAPEDDKEPPETRAVSAANSISHRPKRIASNPSRPSHDLRGAEAQLDKAHRAKTSKKHEKDVTSISHPQPSLTKFPSDSIISHSSVKGRRGAVFPLSGRKLGRSWVSRLNPDSRRLRKVTSIRNLQTRANKRLRGEPMPTLDTEVGDQSARDLPATFLQAPTIQEALVTAPLLTWEGIQSKARRKRPRFEFETTLVASDQNTVNSYEPLGPDVRSSRPLPKRVRDVRLVPVGPGVPRGPSLEHVDQLLRDGASNALAVLREEVGPDIPDWTQDKERDKEHDAEYEDLVGEVQEEANDPAANSVSPKPPVPVTPRIWAQSRQEVCESFEYFRCYHGGVYSKDDIVKGYLLGAYAASRDIFHRGGKLIVSHGGGKSESILEARKGPRRYQTDQNQEASDTSVRALLKTCKDRRPIVLLADDKYALFPYDLASSSYTYVVLGLYWISHAWAERQPARDGSGRIIVRWKFAFHWCEGQGDPWWLPQQEMTGMAFELLPKPILDSRTCSARNSSNPASTGGNLNIQCENCQQHSPFVYKQGWMCLNPRCNIFWSINGEDPKELDYCDDFLSLLPQKFARLPDIIPAKVVGTSSGVTTTYAFSKGWHCTDCGRLTCRYKWEHWECSHCKLKHVVPGRVRSPKEFWHQRPPTGFLHSHVGKDSGIIPCLVEPVNLGPHKGFTNRLTFVLPHGRGKIHLILGTPLSNKDANDIFQMYQQQASTGELKLRRYPLRMHKARGLLLTNYFSQNSGEPYQYVGGSEQTVPFHQAPECVRRALALIKERASLALDTDIPFNEILSAAYMERQKMSFHSDSEKGLGPTVASLSLGSAALMHFRPHESMENPKGRCTYALTLVLRHGDVLIMDGDGVQKYYEHTVVPMNFRIAATARCIGTA